MERDVRQRQPLRRRTALKRAPKAQGLTAEKNEAAAALEQAKRAWQLRAMSLPCARCGFRMHPTIRGVVEGHHVIPLETLKRLRVDESGWYDLRNMLPLCSEPAPRRCHERHENHVEGYRLTSLEAQRWGHPDLAVFLLLHDLSFEFEREYR